MKLNNQIGNKCKDTHTKTVNSCFSKIQSHFTFIKDLHFYLCFLSERSLMKILAFPKERAKIGNSSQFVLHQVIIEASHKLSSKSGTESSSLGIPASQHQATIFELSVSICIFSYFILCLC